VVGWASLCILLVDYTETYNKGIRKEVTNEWLDGVWIKGAIQLGLTPELSVFVWAFFGFPVEKAIELKQIGGFG
jgi:hypothetical protein